VKLKGTETCDTDIASFDNLIVMIAISFYTSAAAWGRGGVSEVYHFFKQWLIQWLIDPITLTL
jgi:hypothetical protein